MADVNFTNLCKEKLGKSLKEEQRIAIESLLQGKYVLAVLSTGFGKSLIFQFFVDAKTIISKRHVSVVVISPLVSIIEDQLLEAKTMGIACCSLKGINLDEMPKLAPKLIFARAEEVQGIAFQRLLKDSNSFLHTNLDLVVVDESHTVETWTGARHKGESKAFRAAYDDLSMLRYFCKQGTPVLALAGTADGNTLKTIISKLILKDPVHIVISPNRTNLRFTVKKKENIGTQWVNSWM